ncbi:hypothetical protein TSUD_390390 [Trifolium subterraneum]|uniref:Reverse transcriptase domain-containing protein n=1 Tax=Trifolium subterraneum TaxID=3900 RepID=A0A2Z6NHJ1_TRISU|nr:hypothetical protein TSUD_390390 [Trifolium subterraneum]
MKDLRPIALCNVLYKKVLKLLANRLKECLDKCISEEQSAFVEGRSILDNVLIAMEGMLLRIGFSDKWVKWMMMCVSSVNYSVSMNFDKVGPIYPGRGLRQGDLLSPYLFILATEGLTALIKQAIWRGEIHGVKICRGAPVVSHLLFADDCFLFCRANIIEATHLMSLLDTYGAASGQEINLSKSEVFFSKKLSKAAQEDLSGIMGVKHVMGTGTYLSLPSMVRRSKKATFGYIKDRIWKKINSWRGKALSKAGKDIMIKSVLQSIPSYIMSVYLLPESIITDIERMFNSSGGVVILIMKGFDGLELYEGLILWWLEFIKLGDEIKIRIMSEPWLRGEDNLRVQSPQTQTVHPKKQNTYFGKCVVSACQLELGYVKVIVDKCGMKPEWEKLLNRDCAIIIILAKGVVLMAAHMVGEWHAVNMHQQQPHLITTVTSQTQQTPAASSRSSVVTGNQMLKKSQIYPSLPLTVVVPHPSTVVPRRYLPFKVVETPFEYSVAATIFLFSCSDRWLKCNVDASFSQASGHMGWGWCLRNSNGVFVAAGINMSTHKLTIVEGEAMAILEAMCEAISRRWFNIVFESDSKVVVDAIHANHQGVSELSSIIASIRLLLQCNQNFEIKFTKRQANMAAHTLARAAISWSSRTFFNYVPHCIELFINNEMS